jgi:hypothetical protein
MKLPHFTVTDDAGERVDYSAFWQRKNLLLVVLPGSPDAEGYIPGLRSRMAELTAYETACVITHQPIEGVRPPAVVIADRWGEVHYAASPDSVAALPTVAELIEWLRYVQMQCPECQGEAR